MNGHYCRKTFSFFVYSYILIVTRYLRQLKTVTQKHFVTRNSHDLTDVLVPSCSSYVDSILYQHRKAFDNVEAC